MAKRSHTHPDEGLKRADHYRDELMDTKIELGNCLLEVRAGQKTIVGLTDQVSDCKKSELQLEREITNLKALVLTREAEVQTARADAKAAEELLQSTDHGKTQAQYTQAVRQLGLREARIAFLEGQFEVTRNDLERTELAKQALLAEEKRLKATLGKAEAKLVRDPRELEALNKTNAQLRLRVEGLDRLHAKAESEVKELRTRNMEVTHQLADHIEALAEAKLLTDDYEQLRESAKELEAKLEEKALELANDIIHEGVQTYEKLMSLLFASAPKTGKSVGGLRVLAGEDYVTTIGTGSFSVSQVDAAQLAKDIASVTFLGVQESEPQSVPKPNGHATRNAGGLMTKPTSRKQG